MGIPGMNERLENFESGTSLAPSGSWAFHTKTLDQIGIEQQTDKATQFSRTFAKPHGYLPHLEKFFSPIREAEIKFLEIGVGGGESIRTWLLYFRNAVVFGVDNVHSTNPWNTVGEKPHDRYKFVTGDQSSEVFWKCFVADYPIEWDVFIDDGGHYSNQVITTLNCMWPSIRSGGLYIIEDLGCSYSPIFQTQNWPTPTERLHAMMDALHTGNGDVDSIYLAKELAVIRKK